MGAPKLGLITLVSIHRLLYVQTVGNRKMQSLLTVISGLYRIYLPNTLLGMFWIRVIESCLIILPKVKDGLDVAVVVVWCKRLVTDVHQFHHLIFLI